jgi:hypothetical protein
MGSEQGIDGGHFNPHNGCTARRGLFSVGGCPCATRDVTVLLECFARGVTLRSTANAKRSDSCTAFGMAAGTERECSHRERCDEVRGPVTSATKLVAAHHGAVEHALSDHPQINVQALALTDHRFEGKGSNWDVCVKLGPRANADLLSLGRDTDEGIGTLVGSASGEKLEYATIEADHRGSSLGSHLEVETVFGLPIDHERREDVACRSDPHAVRIRLVHDRGRWRSSRRNCIGNRLRRPARRSEQQGHDGEESAASAAGGAHRGVSLLHSLRPVHECNTVTDVSFARQWVLCHFQAFFLRFCEFSSRHGGLLINAAKTDGCGLRAMRVLSASIEHERSAVGALSSADDVQLRSGGL